jgi:hypothetical protein
LLVAGCRQLVAAFVTFPALSTGISGCLSAG